MGISDSSASSSYTVGQHAESVYLVAEGRTPTPDIEQVSTSWQRSANLHGVNPVDNAAPNVLTRDELKDLRVPLEGLILSAQEEIDRLYSLVRQAGYAVLVCDTTGVAVEHRGEDAQAERFGYWGTWLGGVWSEEIEGTNGIGTCIAEERAVTVHRGQHFRSRHINLSCSGAPVFGPQGRLMAVLDVSAIDPALSESAHALTGALTVMSARAIEERFFREQFRSDWIFAIALPESRPGILLAVDRDQRIVGANRAARDSLSLDDRRLGLGIGIWSVFDRNPALFHPKDQTDVATQLTHTRSNATYFALVTPPDSGVRSTTNAVLHARPRLDLLGTLRPPAPAMPARGGVSPNAMRRLREYVDANLSERIDLEALAGIAGLSVFHFAREFKQSTGVTPHHYLVHKRVERAQNMLARTDFSLSEIALAAGFADQSHLTRHFRRMLGTTPREFRWSQRP
jgi:transcriptional regulator of acetoin/glycerol metabolism